MPTQEQIRKFRIRSQRGPTINVDFDAAIRDGVDWINSMAHKGIEWVEGALNDHLKSFNEAHSIPENYSPENSNFDSEQPLVTSADDLAVKDTLTKYLSVIKETINVARAASKDLSVQPTSVVVKTAVDAIIGGTSYAAAKKNKPIKATQSTWPLEPIRED